MVPRVSGKLVRPRRRLLARRLPGLLLLFLLASAVPEALAQESRIEGEVFNLASDGERYVVPRAKLTLTRERRDEPPIELFADTLGRFAFDAVSPGRYHLKAESNGLASEERLVSVEAGQTLRLDIELKLAPVRQSVDVSAEAGAIQPAETSSTGSVRASTLTNAPSVNERFESLLPLQPGVVRGPDGFLNLKGARSTQGGLLVNSANVTDPYTGGTAMNLPIDVVSRVEVRSNPYDVAFGKFAGAVTTVDTKPSNFDKFHFTLQTSSRASGGATMPSWDSSP